MAGNPQAAMVCSPILALANARALPSVILWVQAGFQTTKEEQSSTGNPRKKSVPINIKPTLFSSPNEQDQRRTRSDTHEEVSNSPGAGVFRLNQRLAELRQIPSLIGEGRAPRSSILQCWSSVRTGGVINEGILVRSRTTKVPELCVPGYCFLSPRGPSLSPFSATEVPTHIEHKTLVWCSVFSRYMCIVTFAPLGHG